MLRLVASKMACRGSHHSHSASTFLLRRPQYQLATASALTPSLPLSVAPQRKVDINDEEEERRIAMRLFVESLHFATSLGKRMETNSRKAASAPIFMFENLNGHKRQNQPFSLQASPTWPISKAPLPSIEQAFHPGKSRLMNDNRSDSDHVETVRKPRPMSPSSSQDDLILNLKQNIRRHKAAASFKLFRLALEQDYRLTAKVTLDLFFMLSNRDPISAYKVLLYYNEHHGHAHPENNGKSLPMYKRITSSVRLLDPKHGNRNEMHEFVVSLLADVEEMDLKAKTVLYPTLVASLVGQRSVVLGKYARDVYDAMIVEGIEMKLGFLSKLLSMSKYNRQEDLPFHDVLARLVDKGGRPNPMAVLPAIHNMFPYTDAEQMCVALKAWLDLEKLKQDEMSNSYDLDDEQAPWNEEHVIDLSTLEMISSGAARAGSSSLILLVWDILEFCGYSPTEAIFENTVVAFASQPDSLRQTFAAMATMREYGHVPSRPLIRTISYVIRPRQSNVNNGLQVLLGNEDDKLISLESLNVIMSAYAERGETEQTLDILNVMEENNIQPNEDSYSFAIEVLGKEIHRKKMNDDSSFLHKNIDIAVEILTKMEKNGVAPTSDVVRQYLELLCLAGEIETATTVVEHYISNGDECTPCINNKSIYRVALANAREHNLDKAKELAEQMSETIPALQRKIRSIEQRYLHLQGLRKRHNFTNTDSSSQN